MMRKENILRYPSEFIQTCMLGMHIRQNTWRTTVHCIHSLPAASSLVRSLLVPESIAMSTLQYASIVMIVERTVSLQGTGGRTITQTDAIAIIA